jgi:hypothetical protein
MNAESSSLSPDILFSLLVCSLFLNDVPMGFREKVILCLIITRYIDIYVKTQSDIMWVDNQIKKMESEFGNELALRGSDSIEWDRSSS